jgi:ribose 5-phosphate isomerase B
MNKKTIYLGSDHRGFALKKSLVPELRKMGYEPVDLGTNSEESTDYPDYAAAVSRSIQKNPGSAGLLICGTGLGMSMAANKYKGIRAALCQTEDMARLAKEHNNANIMVFGEKTPAALAASMLKTWTEAEFQGGKHQRRIDKIDTLPRETI